MDLQDKTRMQDVYKSISSIIEQISVLPVGQPLVWVWTWDVALSMYKDFQEGGDPDYGVSMDEEEMWELFWTGADDNGFSLEYGTEDLYEAIRDWMIDESIIEEVVDEDDEDVIDSDTEQE